MKKGFTLIELMIVVAIIAIIAAIAIPSLLRARITTNETAAVAACKAFAEAQEMYHRTDFNQNGILEYAMHLSGAYSLYESSAGAGDIAMIDATFAHAEGQPGSVTPKAGYVFAVLTSQGITATGGARSYLTASRNNTGGTSTAMTLGYGLCATPGFYDSTGRNSFIINGAGVIYQHDKGASASATNETLFNPDPSLWIPSM